MKAQRVIIMNWSNEKQARFDDLRQRDLAGTLSAADRQELESLTAMLTQAADKALLPAVERLQRELMELEARLQQRQGENEELAKLLHQQEHLTAESRQWLRDFDRRHAQIRETYARLTGEMLTPG
jgi:predicted nuclease with TOPRIM domain